MSTREPASRGRSWDWMDETEYPCPVLPYGDRMSGGGQQAREVQAREVLTT
jgi:hypothetical protein